jgi:hypothetical protein
MACKSCVPGNQAEFSSEICLHFSGLKNIDKTGVFVFPKLLVCLDCGATTFAVRPTELLILRESGGEVRRTV